MLRVSSRAADDVMKLVKLIREKVMEKNEIWLESEVQLWP